MAIHALIPTTEVQIREAPIVHTIPTDLLRVIILLTAHLEVAVAEVVECLPVAEEVVVAVVSDQVEAEGIISNFPYLIYLF